MLCGDGVQCAGCVGAHLRGLYRKVVVMQEGHNTISWRPSEMRNPRLVVDVQDQLPTKASQKPCERGHTAGVSS